jgi:cysteine-rich repeat protein
LTRAEVSYRRGVSSRLWQQWTCAALVALAPACLDWEKLQRGRCGDGFVGPEERCDDGNRSSFDGCSERCEPETAACGNGHEEPGEDCDDDNKSSGDGCSAQCTREEPLPPEPTCGDGKLGSDEVCDDGNDSNADACLKGCSRATCGDGFVRDHVEECDVSATGADTPCTPACLVCGDEPESFYRATSRHCFTRHLELLTHAQARSACQAEGGDLWTITAEDEGDVAITRMALGGNLWLGLVINEGTSQWVTGEAFDFANFAAGEPGANPARCVALSADGTDNAWQASTCSLKLPFVCERTAPFVDLTSSHAYKVHTGAVTVDEARERCAEEGGALAALESESERAFVAPRLNVRVWVDAVELAEGTFAWSTGAMVDADMFRTGQPDDVDGTQGCLVLEPKKRLSDEPCSQPNGYLCEID